MTVAAEIRGPDDFASVFGVSRETTDRLVAYAALLDKWQRTINLVAAGTLTEVWRRHFADSAQLLDIGRARRAGRAEWAWIDLGSGAGFPGLIVAVLAAECLAGPQRVTLVDSDARKCAFLREAVRAMTPVAESKLRPVAVDIRNARIETVANQLRVGPTDVVSARALAPLPRLLDLSGALLSSGAIGLFPKGREAAAEIEAARAAGHWSFEVERIASVTESDASVLVVSKVAAT